MSQYRVHLYYDGPVFNDDATLEVIADSPEDAIREALVYAGIPKIGKVEKL